MLKLWKAPQPQNHEEFFASSYERLLLWSLRLTDGDQQKAEDLVQDTFVHFALSRPDLEAIENIDGYLYTMLKHTYLSYSRRLGHDPQHNLALVDYDSVSIGLHSGEAITGLEVQEQLLKICEYACLRKESSKAGSVLLLRFFHGYYPGEIAGIMRSKRAVVARWLQVARSEARLYVDDPCSLGFASGSRGTNGVLHASVGSGKGFLSQLVDSIFSSHQGTCTSAEQLRRLYGLKAMNPIDCLTLAHIASCRRCLELVSRLLGIPGLSERCSTDTVDRDKPSKPGPHQGSSGSGNGCEAIRRSRGRIKDTLEHRPKELRIVANGYDVGAQKVSSDISEQELTVNLNEDIGLIEVFSEQSIRVLALPIVPPPAGAFEQRARVLLSDNRTLEASVTFRGAWPTLRIVYNDPTWSEFGSVSLQDLTETAHTPGGTLSDSTSHWPAVADATTKIVDAGTEDETKRKRAQVISGRVARLLLSIFHGRPALRLATTVLVLSIVAVAAVLLLKKSPPARPLSVAQLLRTVATVEENYASRTDQVVHRTIKLDERRPPTGESIARRTVEVWQGGSKRIASRRLFDDTHRLVAGEWTRADGSRTLYRPRSSPLSDNYPSPRIPDFDSVWRLDLSARDFDELTGQGGTRTLEVRPSEYVVRYNGGLGTSDEGLVSASLVVNRANLHAKQETVLLKQAGELRGFEFAESSLERHMPRDVPPSVFEPDPELISFSRDRIEGSSLAKGPATLPERPATMHPTATAELEVEVLRLLNQVGADLGEQVGVTRGADGVLQVRALVEAETRKLEILRALGSVTTNPAVRIEVLTVAEAVRRQPESSVLSGPVVIQSSEPTADRIPADAEVRRYLMIRGVAGDQLEDEIRRLARRVLNQSSQPLQRAWALKNLGQRFSAAELSALDEDGHAKWISLIRDHARALNLENKTLYQQLQAIYPAAAASIDDAQADVEIAGDASTVHAISGLFELCSENDRVIRAAFSISLNKSSASAIKEPAFWRSLKLIDRHSKQLSRQ